MSISHILKGCWNAHFRSGTEIDLSRPSRCRRRRAGLWARYGPLDAPPKYGMDSHRLKGGAQMDESACRQREPPIPIPSHLFILSAEGYTTHSNLKLDQSGYFFFCSFKKPRADSGSVFVCLFTAVLKAPTFFLSLPAARLKINLTFFFSFFFFGFTVERSRERADNSSRPSRAPDSGHSWCSSVVSIPSLFFLFSVSKCWFSSSAKRNLYRSRSFFI